MHHGADQGKRLATLPQGAELKAPTKATRPTKAHATKEAGDARTREHDTATRESTTQRHVNYSDRARHSVQGREHDTALSLRHCDTARAGQTGGHDTAGRKTAARETAHEETAHEETAHEETAHEETAHEETAHEETAHRDPCSAPRGSKDSSAWHGRTAGVCEGFHTRAHTPRLLQGRRAALHAHLRSRRGAARV
jgi:hypothetical protein